MDKNEEQVKGKFAKRLLDSDMLSDDGREVVIATDKFVNEDENNKEENATSEPITFKSIFGGDILASSFFSKQWRFFLCIGICIIMYIANRYECQRQQIIIDDMRSELKSLNFDAIALSSKVTEATRQSKIESRLSKDTTNTIRTSMDAPYVLSENDIK